MNLHNFIQSWKNITMLRLYDTYDAKNIENRPPPFKGETLSFLKTVEQQR